MLTFTKKSQSRSEKGKEVARFPSSNESSAANWTEKYAPKTVEELKLHFTKLKNLRHWFEQYAVQGLCTLLFITAFILSF
jgi:hypothetical protein